MFFLEGGGGHRRVNMDWNDTKSKPQKTKNTVFPKITVKEFHLNV